MTCLTVRRRGDERAPQACVRTSVRVQRGQVAPQGATCQSIRKRGEKRGRRGVGGVREERRRGKSGERKDGREGEEGKGREEEQARTHLLETLVGLAGAA